MMVSKLYTKNLEKVIVLCTLDFNVFLLRLIYQEHLQWKPEYLVSPYYSTDSGY